MNSPLVKREFDSADNDAATTMRQRPVDRHADDLVPLVVVQNLVAGLHVTIRLPGSAGRLNGFSELPCSSSQTMRHDGGDSSNSY